VGLLPLVALAACGGGSPSTFPASLDAIPPPGLCRVVKIDYEGNARLSAVQDCDDVEWAADPGDMVLYRPDDGSRMVVVCFMSVADRGQIDGVDVYHVDTGELIDVIQRYGEPPPEGGCQMALWEWERPR
jgi:hypothetical protein